jgi:hypothetical protein
VCPIHADSSHESPSCLCLRVGKTPPTHSKYHPVMPTRPALLLIVSLSLSGCHNHPAPTDLPNHVSPNEVAVYQAYLQDSFTNSKYPHKMWYVETETWSYPPANFL